MKRDVNLLREIVSPVAGCMLVHIELELDFGPSRIYEKESRLKVRDKIKYEEKKQIDQLMTEFQGLIRDQPEVTVVAQTSIETGSAYPFSRPPYRLDSIKSKSMNYSVCEQLEMGIVRPS